MKGAAVAATIPTAEGRVAGPAEAAPSHASPAPAAVEAVPPSAVSLALLAETELRGALPVVIRMLELAERLVREGVGYRRLRSARRLSRAHLASPPSRLSCSEFVWLLGSLAGLDLGDHQVSSRRLAFQDRHYRGGLVRVTDGIVSPGDVLVYEHPREERVGRPREAGRVGHVVLVVSAEQGIVVGSHGRDSTPRGARRGAGYRRLGRGWVEWSHGRTLTATYRVVEHAA